MSDEEAGMVKEIRLEHLCLGKMAIIGGAGFDRRVASLAAEDERLMRRRALLGASDGAFDVKRAA